MLVRLPGLVRAPVVLRELADCAGRVGRQCVEFRLAQPGVVRRIREELGAFLTDRVVEQVADLFEGAVQPALVARLPPALLDHPAQVVQSASPLPVRPALQATAQQRIERLPRAAPVEDGLAHFVECARNVERGGERVRPAVPGAVAVGSGHSASCRVSVCINPMNRAV